MEPGGSATMKDQKEETRIIRRTLATDVAL
jgi:hypothetical protein